MSEWLWWDDLAAGIPRKLSLSYSTALIRRQVPFPLALLLLLCQLAFIWASGGESPILTRRLLGSAAWLRRTSPRIPINQ